MSFKEFTKQLGNEHAEGELVKTIFISLLTSFGVLAILYFFYLKNIETIIPKYGFAIFFLILSYALILPAIRYVRAYKEFPCMSGMMIGMTIGMIAGFLPGFYIASTNGMFYGSIFGITIGIFCGIWNGKCCGIMGIMEGIMAGFMGGLMGAMTAIMMINDYLKIAGIMMFMISAIILIGLNYMIYNETRNLERKHKDTETFTILFTAILIITTILFITIGPRSVLFR